MKNFDVHVHSTYFRSVISCELKCSKQRILSETKPSYLAYKMLLEVATNYCMVKRNFSSKDAVPLQKELGNLCRWLEGNVSSRYCDKSRNMLWSSKFPTQHVIPEVGQGRKGMFHLCSGTMLFNCLYCATALLQNSLQHMKYLSMRFLGSIYQNNLEVVGNVTSNVSVVSM